MGVTTVKTTKNGDGTTFQHQVLRCVQELVAPVPEFKEARHPATAAVTLPPTKKLEPSPRQAKSDNRRDEPVDVRQPSGQGTRLCRHQRNSRKKELFVGSDQLFASGLLAIGEIVRATILS
mmetsp:Transcript_12570/g.18514  ORF Transcript_12570/g.18514 Transcript_12570/m.18514 type:complete len:121 (-) Transcript_12570:161-523(-)